ncbi:hypothetical protein TFLX_05599 [Thermoflexales bacterium]|nr:hypothetical protein TFLX_05599 [Thermoflexales bacterium]
MDFIGLLLVGLLALISIGAVIVVGYELIRYARRRASLSDVPSVEAASAEPAPAVRAAEPVSSVAHAAEPVSSAAHHRSAPPLTLPELIAEAADTPRDERLINAAASTMKTLPEGVQSAVWVAVVPRQFNAALLAALRPEWGALTNEIHERLERLWFVSAVPGGSCVQSVIRHAMLRHLFRKEEQREVYLRHSLRAAKYFYTRMVSQSEAYSQRNARLVSDTFFRFLPPNSQSPADEIEWLYHLAVADPVSAQPALQQLGDDWLTTGRVTDLQTLVEALHEHIDDGRLAAELCALTYYYAGRVALRSNRLRTALSELEQGRRLSHGNLTITNRIYQAISEALDVFTSPDRPLTPDGSVWSSLMHPIADRAHWGLWADLHLPQPNDDELRRTHEMLLVYQASHNLSGAARAMRWIGDAHLARGDYRYALEWYQNSRTTLQQAARDEGERQSRLLDEAITLKALGDTLYLMGRVDEALSHYEESLQAHQRLPGDELHEADAHKAKGDVLHFLTRYVEALPEYERALAAYKLGGAVISEGETLLAQGRLFQAMQREEEAQRCFEEALGIYRRCGSLIGLANARLVIGSSAQLRRQTALAIQHFEEALKIYRAVKNEAGEAAALKALGDANLKLQQLDQAAEYYQEALTQFRGVGLRRNMAETELAIGQLRLQQQNYQDAVHHYQLALVQFNDIRARRGEADAKRALGEARYFQRQNEEAVQLWSEALAMYRETHDRLGQAQTIGHLGEECLMLHDYAGALTNFEAALNLWREIGDPIGALERIYARVGQSLALLDRRAEAARAFELAMAAQSPQQFGWSGWRAVVEGKFEDALVHFTAMTNREQAAGWQVGLALAQLACGDRDEAESVMAAALGHADPQELGEACRWIEYVARLRPELNLKAEQFGLMC